MCLASWDSVLLGCEEGEVALCECVCLYGVRMFPKSVLGTHPGLVLERKPEASHGPGDITQLRPSRALWGIPAVVIHLLQGPRTQARPVRQVGACRCRPASTPRPGPACLRMIQAPTVRETAQTWGRVVGSLWLASTLIFLQLPYGPVLCHLCSCHPPW